MRARTTVAAVIVVTAGALLGGLTASSGAQSMKASHGRSLGVDSAPNLRDVGGYKTGDGRVVRTGLLYRSSQLSRIPPGDRKAIAALGLKSTFDLRTAEERKALPDELPPGVNAVALDVLADSDQSAPAQLRKVLGDPKGGTVAAVDALFAKAYREFVSLPGSRKAYGRLFTDLAREGALPAVVHCTTGKDRTGWAVAALLALLGVPEDEVVADFLQSNEYVLPAYRKAIDGFAEAGGDPVVARAILGVRAGYLEAAFGEMKERYGTVERYFSEGLGVDAAGHKALRDRLLTHAGE